MARQTRKKKDRSRKRMRGGEDKRYVITEDTPLIENTSPFLSIDSILATKGTINKDSIVKVIGEISVEMKDEPHTKEILSMVQVIKPEMAGVFFVTKDHATIMLNEPVAVPVAVPVAKPVAKPVASPTYPRAKIKSEGLDMKLRSNPSSSSEYTNGVARHNSSVFIKQTGIPNKNGTTDTFAKIQSSGKDGYIKEKYLIKLIPGSILELKKGNTEIPMLQSPHHIASRTRIRPTINNRTDLEVLQENIDDKQDPSMSDKYAEVKYGTITGYLPQSYINELREK